MKDTPKIEDAPTASEVGCSRVVSQVNPQWKIQRADGGVKIIDGNWKTIANVEVVEWECPESGEKFDDEKQTEINAVMLADAPKMKDIIHLFMEVTDASSKGRENMSTFEGRVKFYKRLNIVRDKAVSFLGEHPRSNASKRVD